MPSYAAFIGHQPHLSLAELAATVPGFLLQQKIGRRATAFANAGGSAILFDSAATLDAAFLDTLGGTVVLAEKVTDAATIDGVPGLLGKTLLPISGKVTFSIRTLGVTPRVVHTLYRTCKEHLKKKGKPSRYVGSESAPAPSIVLRDCGLLDRSGGCEIVILQGEDLSWIGLTVGAQDVEAYTRRDMGKPVRDTGVGLLPPKLAQIMINFGVWLATKNPKSLPVRQAGEIPARPAGGRNPKPTILDPFCGTGVIPMEALLRGFPVLASDKAEKAVTGCSKNLEWVRKEFNIKKFTVPSRVWKHDAVKTFDVKETVDVIVTETSLGPALSKRPTARDVQKLRTENEKLQAGFLRAAAQSLPGVPVVCTWPVWYPAKAPVGLEQIWDVASELGYQAVLPPTMEIVDGRMSLLYRRPDQFVGREIVMLRAKK